MGNAMTFGANASFKSIVGKCENYAHDEDVTIEAKLKNMNGPAQPAMNPTEVATTTAKVVTVERHPNDDPNWNGPVKDA